MQRLRTALDDTRGNQAEQAVAKSKKLWRKKPLEKDLAGALSFLLLICPPTRARALVGALRRAATEERTAKDLLRASRLPLLPREDPHVKLDLKSIDKRKPLAPVLLVAGDAARNIPLTVADGYHRICAVYHHDEEAPIACRLVR